MLRVSRTATLGLPAAALLALLTACTQTATPRMVTPTGGPPGAVVIVTRMASASSPAGADHHLTVSVSCLPGEQLLAGGYAAVSVFESDYTVLSAYPSADDTWTMAADSGSSYQLQALAYCLEGYPSLGIRALRANTCPTGMVRLIAGSEGADPVTGGVGTPYVLCAARGVTPTASGVRVGDTELDCTRHATGGERSESRTFDYTCATTPTKPQTDRPRGERERGTPELDR